MDQLPEISRLLSDAGRLYLRRLQALLLVTGVGGALSLLSALLPFGAAWGLARGSQSAVPWVVAGLISVSGVLWFASWMQVAMLEAIFDREDRGVLHHYRVSWAKVIPFSWVCILILVVVIGGGFWLFFPAVYLFIALFFAPVLVVADGIEGFAALEQSLDLVWGRWWGVSGRLLLAAIAASLPGLVPVLGGVLGAVTAPYALVCACLLYQGLRALPPRAPSPPWRNKAVLAAAGLGLVLPAILAVQGVRALPQVLPQVLPILKAEFSALTEAGADPAKAQQMLRLLEEGGPSSLVAAYGLIRSSGTVPGLDPR